MACWVRVCSTCGKERAFRLERCPFCGSMPKLPPPAAKPYAEVIRGRQVMLAAARDACPVHRPHSLKGLHGGRPDSNRRRH